MREEKVAIFIDTNVFEKIGFYFDNRNKLIEQYKKIVTSKMYENVCVSVIDNEIKQHIERKIDIDVANIKKHCKWIYDVIDSKTIESNISRNLIEYEKFKKETNTINIDLKKINPEIVMNKYFNLEYPFELAKKNEFKDAFFLESVYDYANHHETYLSFVVISNDNGIKKAIDIQKNRKIVYFESIQDFIDSITDYTKISKVLLQKYLKEYDFTKQIQEKVNINITDIEEEEIDIDSYECMGIYMPKIIKKTKNTLTVVCDMNINLIGEFKCLDYDNSYYSSEEKEYIYKQYKKRSYLGYICQTIIDIEMDGDHFKSAKIVDLPDIDIDYESFMSIEDYIQRENNN